MVTKTYRCPVHGEFDHQFDTTNEELTFCPIATKVENKNVFKVCCEPVTRVFKKLTYMDSEGFVGKCYGT